jgi:hypothetical protein
MGWMFGIDKPISARQVEPRRWSRLAQPFLSSSSQGHRRGVAEGRVEDACGLWDEARHGGEAAAV